jgi:hypothetical protein
LSFSFDLQTAAMPDSHIPCHTHAMPDHAVLKELLSAMAQRGMGMARYV